MSMRSRVGRVIRTALGELLGGRLVSITYRGSRFYVDLGDGVIGWRLLLGLGFEEASKDLFLRMLRPGDVIFDIGANIGDYTLPTAYAVGSAGRVFAFEPVERSFRVLSKNIACNNMDNVVALQCAVGDSDGVAPIYWDRSNFGGNSLNPNATTDLGSVSNVEISRLDTVCFRRGIIPDLVKVDVQGAELKVLRGALGLLGNGKTAFWLEFWPAGLEAFGGSRREFAELIFSGLRQAYRIAEGQLEPVSRNQLVELAMHDGYTDILSVPRDWFADRNLDSLKLNSR
jgi:FkbM family methyltransferase